MSTTVILVAVDDAAPVVTSFRDAIAQFDYVEGAVYLPLEASLSGLSVIDHVLVAVNPSMAECYAADYAVVRRSNDASGQPVLSVEGIEIASAVRSSVGECVGSASKEVRLAINEACSR